MTKQEIFEAINKNPVFYLATLDGDQPRVRGMLLYTADENGIIFHTASSKDVYKQLTTHQKAEMCFNCNGTQIRITGIIEQLFDPKLKAEIFASPSRAFLHKWKDLGVDNLFSMFCMKNCTAVTWTMAENFEKKTPIALID